jgi:hypothetical protein
MNPLTGGLRKSKAVASKTWIGDFLYGSAQTDQAGEPMISERWQSACRMSCFYFPLQKDDHADATK